MCLFAYYQRQINWQLNGVLMCIFISLGSLSLHSQEERYDIGLKLEAGQTYYQTIRTESDFIMMVNDMETWENTTRAPRIHVDVNTF